MNNILLIMKIEMSTSNIPLPYDIFGFNGVVVKLSPTEYPSRHPNPNMGRVGCFGGKNRPPTEYPNRRPNLGTSRVGTQKCLTLSPRPKKSRLCRPTVSQRGESRGAACARLRRHVCSSAPPRVTARAAISAICWRRACSSVRQSALSRAVRWPRR